MIGPTMNAVLEGWNRMDAGMAAEEVLPCCGSQAWALRLANQRPLREPIEVLTVSEEIWWKLDESDWRQAFETHPRIGERKALATERSLAWSDREQSAAVSSRMMSISSPRETAPTRRSSDVPSSYLRAARRPARSSGSFIGDSATMPSSKCVKRRRSKA